MAEPRPPFLAKSVVKFKSRHSDTDLSFAKDEIVRVLAEEDEDWWAGESEDGTRRGIFPKNFVEALPEPEEEEDEADGMPLPPRPKMRPPPPAPMPAPAATTVAAPTIAASQHSTSDQFMASAAAARNVPTVQSTASKDPAEPAAEQSFIARPAPPPPAPIIQSPGLPRPTRELSEERPLEMPPTPLKMQGRDLSVPTVPSTEQLNPADATPSVVRDQADVAPPTVAPNSTLTKAPAPPRAVAKPEVIAAPVASNEEAAKHFGSASMNPEDAKETIKQGGSLRDRMKLFQAQQSQDQARSATPPAPKPKPSFKKWEAPPAPPAPSAPAATEAPLPPTSPPPMRKSSAELPRPAPPVPSSFEADSGARQKSSINREDAQSAISAGGSLKERIALIKAQQEAQRAAAESASNEEPGQMDDRQSAEAVADSSTATAEGRADHAAEVTSDVEPSTIAQTGPADEDPDASRRTKLAQRMAALGGRSMGMNPFGPPPPVPRTIQNEPRPQAAEELSEPTRSTQGQSATSTMPAIPRRAGPPPRRKHTGSSVAASESGSVLSSQTDTVHLTQKESEAHVDFDPETDPPGLTAPRESLAEFETPEDSSVAGKSPPSSNTREGAETLIAHGTALSVANTTLDGEEDDDVDEITASYEAADLEDDQDTSAATPMRPKGIPPGAFNLFGGSQPQRPAPASPISPNSGEGHSRTEFADHLQKGSSSRRPLPTPPPMPAYHEENVVKHASRDFPLDEVAKKHALDERLGERTNIAAGSQQPMHTESLSDEESASYNEEGEHMDEQRSLESLQSSDHAPGSRPVYQPRHANAPQTSPPPPPLPTSRPSVELARQDRPPIPLGRPPLPAQSPSNRRSLDQLTHSPTTSLREADTSQHDETLHGDAAAYTSSPRAPGNPARVPMRTSHGASVEDQSANSTLPRPSFDSTSTSDSFPHASRAAPDNLSLQRSQQSSTNAGRRVSPTGSMFGSHGSFKAQDIDLAPQTRWWRLQPVAIPFALASRCDVRNPARDAIFKTDRRTIGDGREQLELTILYDDYSSSVIFVQYDNSDQDISVGQRHQAPPPVDGADHLVYVSNQVGRRLHAVAKSSLGKVVGNGSSLSFVQDAMRSTGGLLEPIGYTYGVTVLALSTASAGSKAPSIDEPRPGDVLVLSHARFQGRKGLSTYTQTAGEGVEPSVSIVSEYEGRKGKEGKLRVLLQRPDEAVQLVSFRPSDLKSGSLKVYRVMMDNWVHHWSTMPYI